MSFGPTQRRKIFPSLPPTVGDRVFTTRTFITVISLSISQTANFLVRACKRRRFLLDVAKGVACLNCNYYYRSLRQIFITRVAVVFSPINNLVILRGTRRRVIISPRIIERRSKCSATLLRVHVVVGNYSRRYCLPERSFEFFSDSFVYEKLNGSSFPRKKLFFVRFYSANFFFFFDVVQSVA